VLKKREWKEETKFENSLVFVFFAFLYWLLVGVCLHIAGTKRTETKSPLVFDDGFLFFIIWLV